MTHSDNRTLKKEDAHCITETAVMMKINIVPRQNWPL